MNVQSQRSWCCFFLLLYLQSSWVAAEPISMSLGFGAAAGLWLGYKVLECYVTECCNNVWQRLDLKVLEQSLEERLHGQHLVKDVVVTALRGHLAKTDPRKALALSFHGWTGTGKNYVSAMIADTMYEKGTKSRFVHHFMATHHFPHADLINTYREDLKNWIVSNVSQCERSLFIFDEIDKMPKGLIDVIKPFIEFYDHVDHVSYNKAVFVFLSNTGGTDINAMTLKFWEKGKKREDISMKDMEELISLGAFNEEGGLHNANIIKTQLIDHYVPFLPLEKSHVRMCIKKEFIDQGHVNVTDNQIDEAADALSYFPDHAPTFSKTGCKRVYQKVIALMEKYDRTEL